MKCFPAVVLGILLLAGCASGKGVVREPAEPPAPKGPKVAIAPMENRSNDLDASEIVRAAFAEQIARQGWDVAPTAETDRTLREILGISYGGQLAATTPGEVCRALEVEGVFYGEVREWNKTTTGIYNSVSVAAAFRLYRADGSLAWEEGDTQSRMMVPQGSGGNIGGQIVGHALMNLLMNPMTPYGKAAGHNIAKKLPTGALEPARNGACDGQRAGPPPQGGPREGSGESEETGGTR
ncbi:MAG TPA: GNA1162 family protein [Candidatus Deferrimicrobiaceae bacterium]